MSPSPNPAGSCTAALRLAGCRPHRSIWSIPRHRTARHRSLPDRKICGIRASKTAYNSSFMTGLDDATVLRTLHILAISFGIALRAWRGSRSCFRALGTKPVRLASNAHSRISPSAARLQSWPLFFAVIAIRLAGASAPPRSGPRHPRRIQLPADVRHLRSRPAGKSDASDVDQFRNIPRELVSRVLRRCIRPRKDSPWRSVNSSEIPGLAFLLSDAAMCAAILWMLQAWLPARWAFLGAAIVALKLGSRQLLDEQLLGRRGRRHRRRAGPGRACENREARTRARRLLAWTGHRHSREQPPVRRISFLRARRRLVFVVARSAKPNRRTRCAFASRTLSLL